MSALPLNLGRGLCSQGGSPLPGDRSVSQRVMPINRKIKRNPDKCYGGEVPRAITAGNGLSSGPSKLLQSLPLLPQTKLNQKKENFSLIQKFSTFFTYIKFLMTDESIGIFFLLPVYFSPRSISVQTSYSF